MDLHQNRLRKKTCWKIELWNRNGFADLGLRVSASDLTIRIDNGSALEPDQETLTFVDGIFLETTGGLLANIIVLAFVDSSGEITALFMQPVGSRQGVYMAADTESYTAYSIGDAYMAKSQALAPSLESNTSYEVKVAVAHAGMLDSPREAWINDEGMPYSDTFTTPDIAAGSDYDITGGLLKVFNGSLIAFKNDDDDGGLNNGFTEPDENGEPDFIRLVELYETGAIQGEEIEGGYIDLLEDPLSQFPATFVGFLKKQGESAPSFTGTLNFLARVLYATDYSDYQNAYVTGTVNISGSSATLAWTDAGGSSGTTTLTAANSSGLYHMYGNLDAGTYLDIFWPIGGKKAVYLTADWELIDEEMGQWGWVIQEVGEAYLTY